MNAVTGWHILDGTINAGDIGLGAITTAEILNQTITAADIVTGGVNTSNILDGTILTSDIATDTILAGNIAAGAVTTSEILDDSIRTEDILIDTITAADIATGAIGALELANNSVGSANIIADTIVAGDIATGAVGTAEILDGTILSADIALNTILADDIAMNAVTGWHILDGTINAGDIGLGAITTAEILNQTITAADIVTGGVNTSNILDGTILTSDIATDTILAVDIATGAVATAEILDSTIAPADIGAQDTDTKFVLGRANIGSWSGGTDQAYFGHKDFDTATGYALRQDNTGNVFLNAADTKTISFRQNNLEKANIGPFGFNIASGMTYIHNGVVVIGTDGIIVEAALPRWEHTWWYNEMYESPTVHGGADAYIGANGFTNRIGLKIASGSATPARVSVVVPDNYRDPGAGDIQVRMIVGHAAIAAAATVSWQVVTAADNADWGAPGTYSTWTTGTASGFYDSGWVNLTAASGGAIAADEILTVYFKQTNSSAATVYVYNVMIRGGA